MPKKNDLGYSRIPQSTRKWNDPLSKSDIQLYYKDPHRMLYEGIFWVVNTERVVLNKKTGIREIIEDPDGGNVQPYFPNFEQHTKIMYRRECLKRGIPCNMITVKARRIGESTGTTFLMMAENLPKVEGTIATVSSDPGNKTAMWKIMNDALTYLPSEILPNPNTHLPKNSDNGIRFAVPEDVTLGRPQSSFTANFISAELKTRAGIGTAALHSLFTEFAKWSDDETVLRAVGATKMKSKYSFRAIESTAEGKGNLHYLRVKQAWEAQGFCNWWEPGFKWSKAQETAFFYPWWGSEQYSEPLQSGVKSSDVFNSMNSYESELYYKHLEPRARNFHGLSGSDVVDYCMRQIYYFQALNYLIEADRNLPYPLPTLAKDPPSTVESRKSEYPTYIDEAFVSKESTYLPDSICQRHRENCRHPDKIGRLDESGHFIEDPTGWLHLWLDELGGLRDGKPVNPVLQSLGMDIAHGTFTDNERHDKSAIVGLSAFRRQQTLEVNERVPVPQFESYCFSVAKFCAAGSDNNFPLVCPEMADAGLNLAQRFSTDYPHKDMPRGELLYYTQLVEKFNQPASKVPGYNPRVRNLEKYAWQHLLDQLRGDRLTIRSHKLMDQLSWLVRKTQDKIEAPSKGQAGPGSKDDIADGLKMAELHIDSLEQKAPLEMYFPDHGRDGLVQFQPDYEKLSPYDPRRIDQIRQEEWDKHRDWMAPSKPPQDWNPKELRRIGW